MTPQKRTHQQPEEEPSSGDSQDQPAPGETTDDLAEGAQLDSGLQPQEEPAEQHIPGFQVDDSGGEPEFDFGSMQGSDFEALPGDEPMRAAGRRRRRPNRLLVQPDASELGERLENMARRSVPTFDFFFFSLLSGAILGLGFILDQPTILLFGILVAPLLAPWIGAALAAATGEIRFLGQTLGGFFTGLLLVFITGVLAGLASRIWMPITTDQALLHARLWIPDLLLLAIGTVLLTVALIQKEEKPLLASLMLAYEVYLPVSAAGFGLANGAAGLWPQAALILLIHLAVSMVLALIVFYYMGFRPLEASGYAMAGGVVIVCVAVVVMVWVFTPDNVRGNRATATVAAFASSTPAVSSAAGSSSVASSSAAAQLIFTTIPTVPNTPTDDLMTATPGITPSPTALPTPVYGRIHSLGDGAVIRVDPNGAPITTVQNGYLVEILPDPPVTENGSVWVRIRVNTPSRDIVGWVQLSLISTATPSGPLPPSATPTIKPASP